MGEDTKSNSPDWGAITKWLVIGVVLIVLIFVLKKPLTTFVYNAEDVKISSKGVEIHSVHTAVGDVKYSQEKIKTEDVNKLQVESGNTKVFVSNSNYVLTWPKDTWKKNDEMLNTARQSTEAASAAGYKFDMVCSRISPSKSGFTPNINVIIGAADVSAPFAQQVATYKAVLTSANVNLVEEKIDESTQGAILVYTRFDNVYSHRELYQIQRFITGNGKQYILTATTTTDDDEDTKKELLSILNSFKILEG